MRNLSLKSGVPFVPSHKAQPEGMSGILPLKGIMAPFGSEPFPCEYDGIILFV